MSLQRRLLLYLLIAAPLVWALALGYSAWAAQHEVNELFDTQMIRLAREVQTVLGAIEPGVPADAARPPRLRPTPGTGAAELGDMALAAWDTRGALLLTDREGVRLPLRADATGFVELPLAGEPWRVYYLQSADGDWLVAAGQRLGERDELVRDLVLGQLLPWLLVLPVLLATMAWAVRQALAPLRTLAGQLQQRDAGSLQPVAHGPVPVELQPLVGAMDGLLARIAAARARERRFTSDAAHELRTPLALLRAQWDVLRAAADEVERRDAGRRLTSGIDRMERLVAQMLALSRVDAAEQLPAPKPVDWSRVVEQAMSDTLRLAERRRIELACDWPPAPTAPLPLAGDAGLLEVMLRNLLDNAARYAPEGSTVTLRFDADALEVDNDGPPLPADALAHLGERFHRREGQAEGGSGLGISIVQRIAELHGLALRVGARADGDGVVARVERAPTA